MTVKDVSGALSVSWGLIKEIDKQGLRERYRQIDVKEVRYIAIDEFAIRKGHKYMTVVMDLERRRIIYVREGRSQESLVPFFRRLKRQGVNLMGISMDMWPAYITAATEYYPQVPIVFDRFHIEKNLNKAITDLRKAVYREEVDLNKKKLIKGTQWLLLKNRENLNDQKNEKKRLEEALQVNRPLAIAYYLKEDLKQLWKQKDVDQAKSFPGNWVAKAIASGIQILKKFARSLLAHRTGIFSWFINKISSGPLEGMNNKIKVLKRKAYGYRDMEYFKLKIYNLHYIRYALL